MTSQKGSNVCGCVSGSDVLALNNSVITHNVIIKKVGFHFAWLTKSIQQIKNMDNFFTAVDL